MPFFSIEALKAECDFPDPASDDLLADGLDRMAETAKSAQSTGQVTTMPQTKEDLLHIAFYDPDKRARDRALAEYYELYGDEPTLPDAVAALAERVRILEAQLVALGAPPVVVA